MISEVLEPRVDVSALQEAQATLLMPLWARAMESRHATPLLNDQRAVDIIESLDFDFELFHEKAVPATDYCIRASVIDQVVKRFINDNPSGHVLEVGVGLDTRFDRLDNGSIHWHELDLPGTMEVRRQFFEPTARRNMLTGSLLESDWMADVATDSQAPLIVAEGVLYFFTRQEIKELLIRLGDRFPGASIVFDAQSPLMLRHSNSRHPLDHSRLKFSVGRLSMLEALDSRFQVAEYIGFGDAGYYDSAIRRVSWTRRWGRRLFPPVRHLFKIIRLNLSSHTGQQS
jgi:O-methyltransferase involved in polyketide biosynthesis